MDKLTVNTNASPSQKETNLETESGCVSSDDMHSMDSDLVRSDTRISFSNNNDYYPGTNERICLISGPIGSVLAMNKAIMHKLAEIYTTGKLGAPRSPIQSTQTPRHKQVKILVPDRTAGMIIGKSGACINEIKQSSGAFVQISQKPDAFRLQERCIIISGDMEQNEEAVRLTVEQIAKDPQSTTCLNLSYLDVNRPVASAFATGSPYAQQQLLNRGRMFMLPHFPRLNACGSLAGARKFPAPTQPNAGFFTAPPPMPSGPGLGQPAAFFFPGGQPAIPHHPLGSLSLSNMAPSAMLDQVPVPPFPLAPPGPHFPFDFNARSAPSQMNKSLSLPAIYVPTSCSGASSSSSSLGGNSASLPSQSAGMHLMQLGNLMPIPEAGISSPAGASDARSAEQAPAPFSYLVDPAFLNSTQTTTSPTTFPPPPNAAGHAGLYYTPTPSFATDPASNQQILYPQLPLYLFGAPCAGAPPHLFNRPMFYAPNRPLLVPVSGAGELDAPATEAALHQSATTSQGPPPPQFYPAFYGLSSPLYQPGAADSQEDSRGTANTGDSGIYTSETPPDGGRDLSAARDQAAREGPKGATPTGDGPHDLRQNPDGYSNGSGEDYDEADEHVMKKCASRDRIALELRSRVSAKVEMMHSGDSLVITGEAAEVGQAVELLRHLAVSPAETQTGTDELKAVSALGARSLFTIQAIEPYDPPKL